MIRMIMISNSKAIIMINAPPLPEEEELLLLLLLPPPPLPPPPEEETHRPNINGDHNPYQHHILTAVLNFCQDKCISERPLRRSCPEHDCASDRMTDLDCSLSTGHCDRNYPQMWTNAALV